MLVFHDDNGIPTSTFDGDIRLLKNVDPRHIEVDLSPHDLPSLSDWQVVDGVLVRASIAEEIQNALTEINRHVGIARLRFISDIPGQGMIYLDKEREALAYLATSPEPSNADGFPWIKREIGVTGTSPYEVAQVFVNMAAMWRYIGPELEGLRLETAEAVKNASTETEIKAIVASLNSALELFV